MVGSDGRVYRFLLQFAIPHWTRTDERVAQIHHVLDKILRKQLTSSHQHLSVQPSAVIPVAQRLRMTADAASRLSLEECYRRHCHEKGEDANRIADLYNENLAERIVQPSKDDSKSADESNPNSDSNDDSNNDDSNPGKGVGSKDESQKVHSARMEAFLNVSQMADNTVLL